MMEIEPRTVSYNLYQEERTRTLQLIVVLKLVRDHLPLDTKHTVNELLAEFDLEIQQSKIHSFD